MTEGFTGMDVGDVNFNDAELGCRDGVAEGNGGVSVGTGVEDYAIDAFSTCFVEAVDQSPFVIALVEGEGVGRETAMQIGFQIGKRRRPIDLRFARAKEVEVGAIEDEEVHSD